MKEKILSAEETRLPPRSGSDGKPTVVGIGASAGGLSALKRLFDLIPSDSGLVFVVVVHLSPEHKSHLPDLLQPSVRFPVRQVTETVPLEANNVYVIPPNANLSAIDTHLRLSKLEELRSERAPIDHFFRTLASTHNGHSIGVILTGTGSDGTLGLKEIKAKGGLILVQDPNDAEFDGMPQSAIATGLVDRVLPIAEIPEALLRLAEVRPRIAVTGIGKIPAKQEEVLLPKVLALLAARTERDFTRYKSATILRRVARRMQLNYIEDFERYLERLREDKGEASALAEDLLITVTSFFRDPGVFKKLQEEVVPRLFDGKGPQDSLRIWSVGCATGEEAYSVGMLLLEETARRSSPPNIQIFASDLHKRSLESAREGIYPGDIATDVSADRLRRFFERENGDYRISKEVRDIVVFSPHNLLGDPPFSRLDLITCRNLLIYLNRSVQRDVIDLFHYALRPNGYLLLGSAEAIETPELFRAEDKKLCLYQRRNVPAPEPRLPVFPLMSSGMSREFSPKAENTGGTVSYQSLHQNLLERYAPPSILVGPDDRLVHLSEHAGRYLVHPGGEVTASVLKLVRDELRIDLQALLQSARDNKAWLDSKIIMVRFNGHAAPVVMHVRPAQDREQDGFVLVIFEEHFPQAEGAADIQARNGAVASDGQDGRRMIELEAELNAARQRLQAIIEEHETGREEMKASNEEMQSTNEELRSTMEELETSKEELQSINEELQTVNQENRHKVEELSQLSGDLQNFLAATDIATLFLDRNLRILRFTPRVAELFNIRVTDRGRPISDLTHRLGYKELREDAQTVLDRLIPVEREIRDDRERWYLTRVLPYRSTEDRIEGVVITFTEITTRKSVETALRESEERHLFLLKLSDTLRTLTDPDTIKQTTMQMLGEQLGLNRAFFLRVERENDGWVHVVEGEYRRDPSHPSIAGRQSLNQLGRLLFKDLEKGNVAKVADVAVLAGLTPQEIDTYKALGVAAFINVPLPGYGGYSAGIVAHDSVPRNWKSTEIDLIRDVAARSWDTVERVNVEEKLRQSEQKFRTLANTAAALIWQNDASGENLFITQGFADYTGMSAEEIRSIEWRKLIHPDDATAYIADYVAAVRERRAWQNRNRIRRHDGAWHWFENYAQPLFSHDGKFLGHVGVSVDINEQVHAEELLSMNEKRLRGQKEAFQTAVSGAPVEESLGILARIVAEETGGAARTAFYLVDADLTCLHPITNAGDMPSSYTDLVDRFPIGPESLACGLASSSGQPVLTRDVLEEPLWAPWARLAEEFDFRGCWSFPMETRDRKPIGTFAMYFREPHDPTPYEIGLAEVITHTAAIIISRHLEAKNRRRAEENFGLFVENVREYALVQTSLEGLITNWNPGAERLFGFTAEQMLGKNFSTLFTQEDQAEGVFLQELAVVTAGQRHEDARWVVRQDGSRFWAQWISEPIQDETGQFRGVAKIMRDETDRRTADGILRSSLAEKEELLKEVHHRVKNNLQVIVSLLNMQTSQIQDERVLALFQETRNRVLAVSSIHELLYSAESFASIELSDYARQLAPGLVRFFGLDQRVQVEVFGDGATLELERAVPYGMLLNELVSNACKHAFPAPSRGTIAISIQPQESEIELIVADTGQGLPDNFNYEDASSLGLKLVRGLVRQLRGTLDIRSKPGTTVTVRFPAGTGAHKEE